MRLVVAAALCLAAGQASADEGEYLFSLDLVPEVAWVSHPLSADQTPFGRSSVTTFLPRVGGRVSYGLTNTLALGLGVNGSAFPAPTTKDVAVGGAAGDVASASRVDLLVPVDVIYRLDTGYPLSVQVELGGGPAVVGWLGNVALSPDVVGEGGLPTELGIDIDDQWQVGGFVRAAVMLNLDRVGEGSWLGFDQNGFLLDVGVVTTATWTDTLRAVHVGLLLRPSWAWGGPL